MTERRCATRRASSLPTMKTILLIFLVSCLLNVVAAQQADCELDANGECMQSDCRDEYDECDKWLKEEQCHKNPGFMLEACKFSCGTCGMSSDRLGDLIHHRNRLFDSTTDEIHETPYGKKQHLRSAEEDALYEKTIDYLEDVVFVDSLYKNIKETCKLRHAGCIDWAAKGECKNNLEFMQRECAPACQTCELLDITLRCPMDPDAVDAWNKPDDLHNAFERIMTLSEFSPKLHSHPDQNGPWVVTLDNFLSEKECEILIELGHNLGYIRSFAGNEKSFDGTATPLISESRTSSNTWCEWGCNGNATTQAIVQRLAYVTGFPEPNSEHLQLLFYDVGQFYKAHHDLIPHHLERQPGVRVMTLFMYLNDVEEGGGTRFPQLNNLTVMPKAGRALLWPSVLNDHPNLIDDRTEHEALPVLKGEKYGANAWLHQRNFKAPYAKSCH